MPIGPVSPKDMGRAGRGTSSKNSVTGKGMGKVKPTPATGSKISKGKIKILSNMQAKDAVKAGQLPNKSFSPNNSARQKPVPTKPSKTGPQTRKSVKKGK